ncbi:hypothetical protein ACMXYV_06755 [Neptuniibacter sp. SY11_33]|uniref:hypothetical protein n=1 Tax=Neptuniibacter sp. SY11_33 TaxID=3398215 RepID=UPI0039F47FA1
MNNLIRKVVAFLISITFGVFIYFSYSELSAWLQEPLANATLKILGKEDALSFFQFFPKTHHSSVLAALSNLPLALGLSLFWMLLARNIRIVKSKISYSILVSLVPFFVIYFSLLYTNIMRVELGYEKSLLNYAFGQMSDTLADVFVPYYLLLLFFKFLLIRPDTKGSNDV